MPDDERADVVELCELAAEKYALTTRLAEVRNRMKVLARGIDLPVAIQVGDTAVMVKQAQYHGGVPQTTVAKLIQ